MSPPAIPIVALERVDFLPPTRVTDDPSILTLKALATEPMLCWSGGRPRPGLFDRWALSKDGRAWRLRLREGAAFHDGRPVRAADAAAFLEAILEARDMFGMRWSYARYLEGARIAAEEPGVLAVETPLPFPDLPDILSEFYLPRADAAGRYVIGTGAWRVEEATPGEAALLAHADGRRLRFAAMASAEERLETLVSGRVQAAMGLERLAVPRRKLPGFVWHEQATTLSVIAYMNGFAGAFAHPAARLAANLAVDRERLIDTVLGGLGRPAATVVSPWHTGFTEARIAPMPHDPARARTLIDGSDVPRRVLLRTPTHMPDRAPAIAEFIAESLGEIGLSVRIELARDRPAYARELGEKRSGELAIFDSSPHSTFRVLDDKVSSRSRAVWWQGVEDAEADALFEAARRSLKPAARARAYGAVLRHLHAAPPWLYLFHPVTCMAHAPDLEGLSLDPKGILRIA